MWLWCRWWLLVVVSVSGAPASNSLNTDVAVIEKVNCTPDKDDETAIQRIRAHFLADSCPQGKEASCTWTGDTTASCYLKYYSNSSKTIFKAAALANWDYSTNITEANLKKKGKTGRSSRMKTPGFDCDMAGIVTLVVRGG
ncbi:unnamed protein product [Cyprideis torosa]|uniref:Uncharacterized protein n=1 Tax=Cyprideis torosa TaxID=163714 RepID=A0A7R8W2U9_9CRUS|nr:unnamed protein product [Cyprideis torosa]CAG0882354.1 unnamed protein product [Cyprideis torosa]